MTRKIVGGSKDVNGIFLPQPKKDETPAISVVDEYDHDISIDGLMSRGVQDIYGIMRSIRSDIATGAPSRETVQNLKDCLIMLTDLKKKEQELIDSMSDEQITKLLKSKKVKK